MEEPASPVFCVLCAPEAPCGHNLRSERMFDEEGSGPTMTDLYETFFIHTSPIEDLKGHNFSHLALILK